MAERTDSLFGAPGAGADVLEARVEQLRDVYVAGGLALVRPREQLALAAAMAPWTGLARRLWRRVSRSLART